MLGNTSKSTADLILQQYLQKICHTVFFMIKKILIFLVIKEVKVFCVSTEILWIIK